MNRLPGKQFITAPAGGGGGGGWVAGLVEADAAGCKAKGGRKQLRQEVGGVSTLLLPGSGCKGSWVCTPRCSWPTWPSGGERGALRKTIR